VIRARTHAALAVKKGRVRPPGTATTKKPENKKPENKSKSKSKSKKTTTTTTPSGTYSSVPEEEEDGEKGEDGKTQ
jgi:hypothetical protein